jgi:methylase of polypeptide subunit release factors
MEKVFLDNNIILRYPIILDGGGSVQRFQFVDKVKQQNKTYKSGLEWCAGMGLIGYNVFSQNLCETMSFNDLFEPAIQNILENATNNQVSDKINAYLGNSISVIPTDKKFDLVVSNPPHTDNSEGWREASMQNFIDSNREPWTPELYDNWERLIVDEEWKSHYDFFKHLKNYLLPDADIFISEYAKFDVLEELFQKDFDIMSIEDFPALGPHGLLYHLKAKQ